MSGVTKNLYTNSWLYNSCQDEIWQAYERIIRAESPDVTYADVVQERMNLTTFVNEKRRDFQNHSSWEGTVADYHAELAAWVQFVGPTQAGFPGVAPRLLHSYGPNHTFLCEEQDAETQTDEVYGAALLQLKTSQLEHQAQQRQIMEQEVQKKTTQKRIAEDRLYDSQRKEQNLRQAQVQLIHTQRHQEQESYVDNNVPNNYPSQAGMAFGPALQPPPQMIPAIYQSAPFQPVNFAMLPQQQPPMVGNQSEDIARAFRSMYNIQHPPLQSFHPSVDVGLHQARTLPSNPPTGQLTAAEQYFNGPDTPSAPDDFQQLPPQQIPVHLTGQAHQPTSYPISAMNGSPMPSIHPNCNTFQNTMTRDFIPQSARNQPQSSSANTSGAEGITSNTSQSSADDLRSGNANRQIVKREG